MANKSIWWAPVLIVFVSLAFIGSIIGVTSLRVDADDVGQTVNSQMSLSLQLGETLRVHTMNGSITYESWDGDEVDIESNLKVRAFTSNMARRFAEQVDIDVGRVAGGIVAEARIPDRLKVVGDVVVDFHVRVPRTWTGSIDLHAANGPVNALNLHGDATVTTSFGPITIRSHSGSLQARTSYGAITLFDADTTLQATTSNGSINVHQSLLRGDGYAKASSGAVRIQAALDREASFDVDTSHGNVTLTLAEPDVDLHLEASNGYVRLLTDVDASEMKPDKVVGRVGAGSARLSARSTNGSIEFRTPHR